MEKFLIEHKKRASEFHNKANCNYDGKPYIIHLDMVVGGVIKYKNLFLKYDDYVTASVAGYYHDTIEDAQLTFNDVMNATSRKVARVVLDVTDVHEENRLLRHLFTMGKTVKNHISIIVKMCDMRANGMYSKEHGSRMYDVYVEEYLYRRPIFMKALNWYGKYLDTETLNAFWDELDEIHGYKKQV